MQQPRIALLVSLACLVCLALPLGAAEWERWSTPEEAGFSSSGLAEAERLWQAVPDAPIASFFVVYRGKVLASFGRETYPYWCHSMRKSFLSALYGIHVDNGSIDLDMTMAELGIDDTPPLTATEKRARVMHLLKARSGVYHEAACEAQSMKDARPERGSHPPDTFWYYNNWDFNALGSIFRQEAGSDIFEEFAAKIGRPIGMQDFEPVECEYYYETHYSEHPCYTFRMSMRDRARFGQLFLQRGRWGNRQIVSPAWHEESTTAWSATGIPGRGYAYMWWTYGADFFRLVFQDGRLHHLRGYAASGYGGQLILVLPDAEMVVVFGVDVPAGGDLDFWETNEIVEAVLASGEIVDLRAQRLKSKPQGVDAGDELALTVKIRNRSAERSRPTSVDFYLAPEIGSAGPGEEALLLGSEELPALGPGKRRTVRIQTVLPEGVEPGNYHLAVVVDGAKSNFDLRRENNLAVGKQAIEIH
jgi:CubicO group peptidase (beta-lactamase class C family)